MLGILADPLICEWIRELIHKDLKMSWLVCVVLLSVVNSIESEVFAEEAGKSLQAHTSADFCAFTSIL